MAETTPSQHCYLWDCPQEVLDMIFGLAFQVSSGLKLTSKRIWEREEEEKKKVDLAGYVETPFPSHGVDVFMVSKRFLVPSTAAFFGGASWNDDCLTRRDRSSVSAKVLLRERNGLFMSFAKQLKTAACFSSVVVEMARLRNLEMSVYEFEFSEIKGRYPWEHRLTDSELEQLGITRVLGKAKQLKTLTLSPSCCSYANTDEKKDAYAANVKALEALINKKIALAKQTAVTSNKSNKSSSTCIQLYFESRVCFGCSKMDHVFCEAEHKLEAPKPSQQQAEGLVAKDDQMAWFRPKNLPDSKEEIRGLIQSHTDQLMEYLYEQRQEYKKIEAEEEDM